MLLLSQLPPPVSHPASAPSRSAAESVPHAPVQAACAAVRRSAPPGGAAPSRLGPVESVRQPPPPDSHSADAPSRSARLDWSHPLPSHLAEAFVTSPSAPRLDALLPQPESSHEATAFEPPADEDAPHPDDTPDRHSVRSESRLPSPDSDADPQPVNAPSESHPAAEPSPSRSSSDTVDTCRSVASISSSVAS
ncbi:hypothetical protein GCM10023320_34410 [Pseudonocardia adelaidensis]|uniref:Uncharacterized protein n=1 Tax=Pseudonocardia adelaidensis TaxID=648754 RepID=A0ABP9NL15_9PSEU